MTIVRILAVVWVFAVAGAATAQPYPTPRFHPPDPRVTTPDISPATYEFFDTVRLLQIFGGVAVLVGIPGWLLLKFWSDTRRAKDPAKLAMADPWMRAKLETMSEQERAEFLAQIGK
jgi:hypothetical protein